ncbi:L,D-transpeptidase family protein [Mariniluteicoccus flavus]
MKASKRIAVAVVSMAALTGIATTTAAAAPVPTAYTAPKVGQSGAGVKALQQRLVKAGVLQSRYTTGYFGSLTRNAVKAFQRRERLPITGRVDIRTWNRLVTTTGTINAASASTSKPAAKGLDSRCMSGRVLCISKRDNKVRWVVDGSVQMSLDARFGSSRTPTRNGTFRVYWKSRNHHSTLYGTSMPYALFFSGGQAVHYSPDFAARGYNGASHGCVNTRDRATMQALFTTVRSGDKVVVY